MFYEYCPIRIWSLECSNQTFNPLLQISPFAGSSYHNSSATGVGGPRSSFRPSQTHVQLLNKHNHTENTPQTSEPLFCYHLPKPSELTGAALTALCLCFFSFYPPTLYTGSSLSKLICKCPCLNTSNCFACLLDRTQHL